MKFAYRQWGGDYIEYTDIEYGYYEGEDIQIKVAPLMMCDANSFRQRVSPSLCSKLFSKELLLKIIMEEDEFITLGEDAGVSYFCIYNAKKIFVLRYAGYFYRLTPNSMTKRKDSLYYERLASFCRYVDFVIDSKKWYGLQYQYDLYKLYLFYRQFRYDVRTEKIASLVKILQITEFMKMFSSIRVVRLDCCFTDKIALYLIAKGRHFSIAMLKLMFLTWDNLRNLKKFILRGQKHEKNCHDF